VTTDRLERIGFTYTGTPDDVRREMDAMVENVHPDWFVWQGDQGLLPKEVVREQIELFGKHVIPRYA
jgi:alkanesulfonate monooxygenase SsuD/methylene tetrahydromethanopterin reductase-like flavin-dependent oxidoreductase (luciferase family)